MGAPAEKAPPEPDTAEEAPTWEPTPWGAPAEKARLVGWAEWAASTTFSSTGLRFGYDKREVDAFRSAVRDTFLGVSKPPVRSDDLRRKQFSTRRPGYDKTQVAAFLEAAGIRLAAMESTDRPAGPLVTGARLVLWAEWADSTTFRRGSGYTATEVDNYLRAIRDTFLGVNKPPLRSDDLRGKQFPSTEGRFEASPGYDKTEVELWMV
jgi:DivIVA domain-containing protein